jgi:hypothetical protein
MIFVEVVDSEPVAEKHICWFVVEQEKDYVFSEVVEELYLDPVFGKEITLHRLVIRSYGVYCKKSTLTSALAMITSAENTGNFFHRRAGYSLDGDIIRVNDSEGRLPLISEYLLQIRSSQK